MISKVVAATNQVAFIKITKNCNIILKKDPVYFNRYIEFLSKMEKFLSNLDLSIGFKEFIKLIGIIEYSYQTGKHNAMSKIHYLDIVSSGTGITDDAFNVLKDEWCLLFEKTMTSDMFTPGMIVFLSIQLI